MLPIILYENILRDGTLTVSGTDADTNYNMLNIIDYKSYSKWKADSISDPWIAVELIGADTPDCIGIYNHNFNEIGGTIKLQYDNAGWLDLATITPNGTYPILLPFTAQSSTKFRLLFTSPTIVPEVAVIFLGHKMEFPYPPDAPATPGEEGINASMELSEAGHNLGAVISHFPLTISQRFTNITRTWFDANYRLFWFNHARYLIPFFYGFDLTNRPNDAYYVTVDQGMKFKETLTILSLTDSLDLIMKGISSDKNYSQFIWDS